jgi:transcriptional regulator with XRE-family HTH domain
LADAIRAGGYSVEDLAERVGVDAKTVRRWVTTGRVPHLGSRVKVASVLGVSSAMLWPEVPSVMDGTTEVVGVYTTRAQLSPATIGSLLAGSSERIDVLAYGALWLWDSVGGFPDLLAAKASNGVHVRICLGNPDSEAVRRRGEEEGIGDGLASRCRLAASYAAPLRRVDAESVRRSGATLYASIFRFDDDLLLNTHLWGNAASDSPVFHLRRHDDRGVFANAVRSFERVWKESQPVPVG